MAYSESQNKATQNYKKKNVKKYLLELNRNTDQELIDKMESVQNKQGYLKELIKKDINNTCK